MQCKNLTGKEQRELDLSMLITSLLKKTGYNVPSDTLGLFSRQEVHCYSR